jgi:hypothetical protein
MNVDGIAHVRFPQGVIIKFLAYKAPDGTVYIADSQSNKFYRCKYQVIKFESIN